MGATTITPKQAENSKTQELWKRDFEDNGSGQSTPLSLKVESINPPYGFANRISFSPDRKWIAVFVPGVVETSELRIYNLEKNQFMAEVTLPLLDGELVTRKLTTTSGFNWSPTKNVLAFCKSGGGADDAYNALYGGALFLVNEGKILPITESKCGQTQISWRARGEQVAYLNSAKGISIVNTNGNVLYNSTNIEIIGSSNLSAVSGPWWSPDGTLIGIVADNKICLAHVEDEPTQLLFECVVEGAMMTWRP